MKNFIFTLTILISVLGYANGQKCNDLIITEIVFGGVGSSLSEGATQFNHSVEVYNPTDDAIDLESYSIELVPETGEKTVIQLEGIVPSKDVFVISNTTANAEIVSVSDVLDLLLSFESKVAVQLTKITGEIIDKIGKQGVEQSSETIDLDALLNDPNYLEEFDINLGSIRNLLIKRKAIIQEGNEDFQNEDFLKEWLVLPNFEISDLGEHLNACAIPMIYWEGINQFEPEKILLEQEGASSSVSFDYLDFASGTVRLTEAAEQPISFSIFSSTHEYPFPINEGMANSLDWSFNGNIAQDFVIPAGETSYEFDPLAWAIIDGDNEGSEGFGLKVNAALNGQIIADPDNDLFDIRILDPLTSTKDLERLNAQFKVFPVIAEDVINLTCSSPSIKIKGIGFLTIDGKRVSSYTYTSPVTGSLTLDLNDIQTSGYHLMVIHSTEGFVTKKFYKK